MAQTLSFKAGAGRGVIRYPIEEFPFKEGPDYWTGIHDDPGVRVVILDCGIKMVWISLEIVILQPDMKERVENIVSEKLNISKEYIWISATHTVSVPHFFIMDHDTEEERARSVRMRECIYSALKEALDNASSSMQQASIGYGSGTCTANVNRVISTCDGWWLGSGEEYEADHNVPVICINGRDGDPIAIFYNYSTELAVMDKSYMTDGGRHITADLAGAASRFIEEAYDDSVVAFFLPGVTADQGPAYRAVRTVRGRNGSYRTIDIKDQGWLLLELEGERLGEQVLVTAEKINCAIPTDPIRLDCATFWFPGQKMRGLPKPDQGPVKEWTYIPDGEKTRSVDVMTWGDLAIVGVGGISVDLADKIRENSPFKHTVIVSGLTGKADPLPTDGEKNMVSKDLYNKITFQSRNSEFAAGSGEMMADDVTELLWKIKNG